MTVRNEYGGRPSRLISHGRRRSRAVSAVGTSRCGTSRRETAIDNCKCVRARARKQVCVCVCACVCSRIRLDVTRLARRAWRSRVVNVRERFTATSTPREGENAPFWRRRGAESNNSSERKSEREIEGWRGDARAHMVTSSSGSVGK